ncbi:OV-16 antigen [Sphaceloma murrayae]|uniref:OV-16 antigen n=1 Tax=Sphaceloma murrayae TaxID=2082308 RepID=A0A2K1R3A3_9PEZI|nr:OV-16 antigen [Sphaceloma murrayae]
MSTISSHSTSLITSLKDMKLSPGQVSLIPESFIPTTELGVTFGDKQVKQGNLIRVSEAKCTPTISFAPEDGASRDQSYTLMLVDPDAPTPDDPKFAWWRHWIISGLRPGAPAEQTKEAVTAYLAPGPKDDSKPHRYLFLLYKEPENFNLMKIHVGGEEFVDRRSFKAETFVREQGLLLVGLNWMRGAGDGWKDESPGWTYNVPGKIS